jgi:hypothetical protein
MTPPDLIRHTRATLGLSARLFAIAVHAGAERTVRHWEAGDRSVPGPVTVLCRLWLSGKLPPELVPTKARPDVAPDPVPVVVI